MTERTRKMHKFLTTTFGAYKTELSYLSMVDGKKKKTVIGTFAELLELKTRDIIGILR